MAPPPAPPPPMPLPSSLPRRRLYSRSDDLRLAVPLSCEIWNLVLPDNNHTQDLNCIDTQQQDVDDSSSSSLALSSNHTATEPRSKSRWWQQQQHQSSVLEQVELQIVVHEDPSCRCSSNNDEGKDGEKEQYAKEQEEKETSESDKDDPTSTNNNNNKQEIVLYCGANDNGRTVHPCWFHLQEKLSGNDGWNNLHRDTYESVEFCFSTLSSDNDTCNCFLRIPVHPSQLVSLGDRTNDHQQITTVGHSTLNNLQGCPTLPVNTLVVHFSDHTSRILPQHYALLSEHHPTLFSSQGKNSGASPATHRRSYYDRQSSLVPRGLLQRQGSGRLVLPLYSEPAPSPSASPPAPTSRFKDDAFRALDPVQDTNTETKKQNKQVAFEEDEEDNPRLPSRNEALVQELHQERERLLQQIAAEQEAYENETRELKRLQANIYEQLQPTIAELQEQTAQIQEATAKEDKEIAKLNLLLELHRTRLVRGLESFFPIENPTTAASSSSTATTASTTTSSTLSSYLLSGGSSSTANATETAGPTLRGWSLPSTGSWFTSTAAADDELSAVLGALAHLVSCLGKYLGVPLRYRVFSNSSRSAIQDDHGVIHPLFLARPVERDQVQEGLRLLDRNVMCMAQARGVNALEAEDAEEPAKTATATSNNKPLHIFEKVQRIYQATSTGLARV